MLKPKITDFFVVKDNFAETAHVKSIPVFENRLPHVPKFTVVIPTYKRGRYLKDSLEAVLNQDSNVDFEVLVCDNHPERGDETEQLMMEYSHVPNLSYFKNEENVGMSGNWNQLMSLTRSEWFTMVHDDDILAPYYMWAVNRVVDILPAKTASIHGIETFQNSFPAEPPTLNCKRFSMADMMYGNVMGRPSGVTYRASAIRALGGWDGRYYPSLDYCMECFLQTKYEAYQIDMLGCYIGTEVCASQYKKTQVGTVTMDWQLRDAILKRYCVPKWIRDSWNISWTKKQLKEYDLTEEDVFGEPLNYKEDKLYTLGVSLVNWTTYQYNKHFGKEIKIQK